MPITAQDVPKDLKKAIIDGSCVAFVGAGFTGGLTWKDLLKEIARLAKSTNDHVKRVLEDDFLSSQELEIAAQSLLDELQEKTFRKHLKRIVSISPAAIFERRYKWLYEIPFQAILTTNFDPHIHGMLPEPSVFRTVLQTEKQPWWDKSDWKNAPEPAQVVKLHGDVKLQPNGVVLCTRDYRRRLFHETAYLAFLRSIFATRTVLFLGYSLTDAYLNLLRSEVLETLGHKDSDPPLAYAVMKNVNDLKAAHYRKHEGIGVLSYSTREGTNKHEGFDEWLRAIHDATNPTSQLRELLRDKKVLWLDTHPDNNTYGMKLLQDAGQNSIKQVTTVREAIDDLEAGSRYDLIITHWGHNKTTHAATNDPCSNAERLCHHLQSKSDRPPVICFSARSDASKRRSEFLRMGGQEYTYEWSHLFREIDRVLRDPFEKPR